MPFALLIALLLLFWSHTTLACKLTAAPAQSVARVTDGQTVVLADGTKVMLGSVLVPRAEDGDADPGLWQPEIEARTALERLVAGRGVGVAGNRRLDRYGRLVSQLVIAESAAPLWVQAYLVENGYARVHVFRDDPCAAALLAYEAGARQDRRGLWKSPHYMPLSASRPFDVLRRRDTYQIVAGRVTGVTTIRSQTYINFGADWREDFTVGAGAHVRRRLIAGGIDVTQLAGRLVEARGWIERKNGPYIELESAEQLRVLDDDTDEPSAAQVQ